MNDISDFNQTKIFTDYFYDLGSRWGLNPKSTALHALLYVAGPSVSKSEIKKYFQWNDHILNEVVEDLISWDMISATDQYVKISSLEPWDLMFSAIEQRQYREIKPMLDMLDKVASTGPVSNQQRLHRIQGLQSLVSDLDALVGRLRGTSPRRMSQMLRLGGRVSRLFGKQGADNV
tara:strand:- start:665 stop:1192 length:528 start_codon:yes stop_codon:yes gene_type:complete